MFCKAFGYRRVLGKAIIGNIKSNYMTFWKRQYYGDSKKVSGCQGFTPAREAGGKGGARGIFRAVKLFRAILEWWVHVIIHLPTPLRCTSPRVNPLSDGYPVL